MSIRLKIIVGCLCLGMLTVVVGLFALASQRQIGDMAAQLYDNSLLSTNALRSAQASVTQVRSKIASGETTRGLGEPLSISDAEAVRAELSAAGADLSTASAGSVSKTGRDLVDQTRMRLDALLLSGSAVTTRLLLKELGVADQEIGATVRVFAADAFNIKGDVRTMTQTSLARTWATIGAAITLTFAIAWLLSRMIVPSLRRAVAVAKAIAKGDLANDITPAGSGETNELLSALAVMQSIIAERIDRFETRVSTQASALEDERAMQSARLQAAFENISQGLCMFDAEGKVILTNQRFSELFEYPEIQLGTSLSRLRKLPRLAPIFANGKPPAFTYAADDGRIVAVAWRQMASGEKVFTVEDVTERHTVAARLDHAANHDSMTGLANRVSVQAKLETVFSEPDTVGQTAILCLDIDNFKFVNELFGHPVGDALLQQVAKRLVGASMPGDLVARVGGDDFAIVRTGVKMSDDMKVLAGSVIELLSKPFNVLGHDISVGVSIGIAPSAGLASEIAGVDKLFRKAELALGVARSAGRNNYCFFEPSMEAEAVQRRRTELELTAAMDNGEFELFYQPFIDVPMRTISGFEALLRWRHPERGLVSPNEFVPIAEASGLIQSIGLWTLETACRQAVDWPVGLNVSVNLSPSHFGDSKLVENIKDILRRTAFTPHRLQIEVTEGVLMHNTEQVASTLAALRKLGIRVSMDDFGTGYSSLAYLSQFPFDKVKIDQSFVRDLMKRENLMIVRAIISLAKAMELSVVAEGVETRRQMETLLAEDCVEMQGYYFGMPMPLSDLPRYIMQFAVDRSAPTIEAARSA